jgi:predicted MFS family arabinose efflux permease
MVSARPLPAFLAAFAFPSFRRLWAGAFLSTIGTWVQDVALAWIIHTRIGDPLYLGVRAFAADVPLLAFMLLGGAVADRVDRRRILLTSQTLQMSFALVLGFLWSIDRLGIEAILLVAFLTGLAQSQSAPTYQAVLTSVVPPAHIPNAVALNSLQFNLSRAIGPVIAGALLARGGTTACFFVNAVSFLAVIAALWGITIPPRTGPASTESLARSLGAGLRHVGQSPVLRRLTLLGAAGSFLCFPLITYLPVFAGDVLKTGAAGYSLLLTSFGCGAIVGAIWTAHHGSVPHRGRRLLLALVAYGLVTTLALAMREQRAAMVLLFVSGATMVTAFSTLNSLVQENAPEQFKGRILSIYGLAFRGGLPLGALAAGAWVGPLGMPAVLGAFSVAIAALAALVLVVDRGPSALRAR